MIFRQLFDRTSYTYSYILGGWPGGQALIIDPVHDQVDRYIQLLGELDLRLIKAIDTHVHADHISGLGALRDRTRCITVMGKQARVDVVSMRVSDGDVVDIDGVRLTALYTPGHTDDSYSFLCDGRVFTGDTLFIRGTGRTDFETADPAAQYHSLFDKLLTLPDDTLVYPGHDYKGDTVSTIGEERRFNPRLRVSNESEFIALMNSLGLADPKLMDVAVSANLKVGLSQDAVEASGCSLSVEQAKALMGRPEAILIDLRDETERKCHGVIPGSVHVPYPDLTQGVAPGGLLHALGSATGRQLVFYCAYGERSLMAVQAAREAGLEAALHVKGGIDAWKTAGEPILSLT
ncbi:MAG: MBL fold metallo-hydrolase [Sphingomonadales bacterium]